MPIVSFAKMNVNRGSDQSASPVLQGSPSTWRSSELSGGRSDVLVTALLPGLSIDLRRLFR